MYERNWGFFALHRLLSTCAGQKSSLSSLFLVSTCCTSHLLLSMYPYRWALSQRRAPSPIEDYSMQKSFLTNGCDWNHTNSHLNNYQIITLSDSFHIRTALQSKVTKPKPLLLSHWCFSAKCNAKADFYCEFNAVMICGSNFYKIFEWLLLFLFDITTLCTVSTELYMMPLRSHRFILTSQSHCLNSL